MTTPVPEDIVDEKVCDIKHVAGMRPHRHITVPIRPDQSDVAPTTVQYVCRCCGGDGAHETAFVCQDGTDDCFCVGLTGPVATPPDLCQHVLRFLLIGVENNGIPHADHSAACHEADAKLIRARLATPVRSRPA